MTPQRSAGGRQTALDLSWHLAGAMGLTSQALAKNGPGIFIFIRFPLQLHSNANKAPNEVSRHGALAFAEWHLRATHLTDLGSP